MQNPQALNRPIKELSLSEEFKNMAEINHFENIEDILSFPVESFLQRQGVNYHLYKELADYLNENALLHLFQHQY